MGTCSDHVWCGCDGPDAAAPATASYDWSALIGGAADPVHGYQGHVYVLQGVQGGPVRIGFTRTYVHARLAVHLTSCPWPLVILGVAPAQQSYERQIHRHFSASRTFGEWFSPTAELAAFVAARTTAYIHEGYTPGPDARRTVLGVPMPNLPTPFAAETAVCHE